MSNKTSEVGDASVDPLEALLYNVFVASSERLCVAELATILNVEPRELQAAMALACRLGFATRLSGDTGMSGAWRTTSLAASGALDVPEGQAGAGAGVPAPSP